MIARMTLTNLLASAAYRDYLLALDAYLKKQPFRHEAPIEPIIVHVQAGGRRRWSMSVSTLAC